MQGAAFAERNQSFDNRPIPLLWAGLLQFVHASKAHEPCLKTSLYDVNLFYSAYAQLYDGAYLLLREGVSIDRTRLN